MIDQLGGSSYLFYIYKSKMPYVNVLILFDYDLSVIEDERNVKFEAWFWCLRYTLKVSVTSFFCVTTKVWNFEKISCGGQILHVKDNIGTCWNTHYKVLMWFMKDAVVSSADTWFMKRQRMPSLGVVQKRKCALASCQSIGQIWIHVFS